MNKMLSTAALMLALSAQAMADGWDAPKSEEEIQARVYALLISYRDTCPEGKVDLMTRLALLGTGARVRDLDAIFAAYSPSERQQAQAWVGELRKVAKDNEMFCRFVQEKAFKKTED